jgi:hypothetical protein
MGDPAAPPAPAPAGDQAAAPAPVKKQEAAPAGKTQQQTETAPVPAPEPIQSEPYTLEVPPFVSQEARSEAREGWFGEFERVAPSVGITQSDAQGLIDMTIDAAVHLDYVGNEDATAEDATLEMQKLFGDKAAANIIENCQRYVKSKGEVFSDWLTETGLGNDPAIIVALAYANMGLFNPSISTQVAQAELTKTMQSPEYMKSDKMALLRVQLLSRIVHRNALGEEQQLMAAARARQQELAAPPRENPLPKGNAAAARKEMASLMRASSPLFVASHPQHAAAVKRFQELSRSI